MTKDFNLTTRAKKWINAIQSHYKSIPSGQPQEMETRLADSGGFKFL
jgi:hypothetical protein